MTYTSLVMKFVVSTFLIASLAAVPTAKEAQVAPTIEYPVQDAIATSSPKAVVKRVVVAGPQGDCAKYASLIEKYDWATNTAMEICKFESRGNPSAIGDTDTDYVSCGLMQIRTLSGRPTCDELLDPELNVRVAYGLWKEEGFRPWSVCRKVVDCD